jgi:hypothetical protein
LGSESILIPPPLKPSHAEGIVVHVIIKMSRSCLVGAAVFFGTFSPGPWLRAADLTDRQIEDRVSEAIQGFDTMTELWQEGRYDDLYDWGTEESRESITPERFSFFMRNATRFPQCCFKRFQEAEGRLKAPDRVEVTVTIGYQYTTHAISRPPSAPILPEEERDSVVLVYEAGRWRMDLNQLLDLAWIPGRPY